MKALIQGFHKAYNLIGAIGTGIDISAANHLHADHNSAGQAGQALPWTPVTAARSGNDASYPPVKGNSSWYVTSFLSDWIPDADAGKLFSIEDAFKTAAASIENLVAGLQSRLWSLIGNNTSTELPLVEAFWQQVAGPKGVFVGLTDSLTQLGGAMSDFVTWNDSTQEEIKAKIGEILAGLGVGGILFGIASLATDGALDVVIVGAIEALDAIGVNASGALVAPIVSVVTDAISILTAAGGAIAVASQIQPAMQVAMNSSPEPNTEITNTTQTSSNDTIDQSAKPFDPSELKIAQRLSNEGHDVTSVKEVDEFGVRTGDALVDGKPTEFKAWKEGNADSTKILRTLSDSSKGGGQAPNMVLNYSESELTEDEALRGIKRYLGTGRKNYEKITIWGNGWTVTWP